MSKSALIRIGFFRHRVTRKVDSLINLRIRQLASKKKGEKSKVSIGVVLPGVFVLFMVTAVAVIAMQLAVKKGLKLSVRRIEALDRVDDLIGRTTEMGGTLVLITGYGGVSAGAGETMCAFSMVQYVTERTAKLGTRVLVAAGHAEQIPILEDMVQTASTIAGNPEYYKGGGEIVRLISGADTESYGTATLMLLDPRSGVNAKAMIAFGSGGVWNRDAPQVGITANLNGIVTLAGTAALHQIYNYIACFDYAVISDEVFAMSAYLTHEQNQLGTIAGTDFSKLLIIGLLIAGFVYAAASGGRLLFQ